MATVVGTASGDAGTFNGACSYLPGASQAGMLLSQLAVGAVDKFRIFLTGRVF